MDEYDTYFQRFAEMVAAKLKEEDLLHLGDHMRPLSDPPLDVGYERVKEIIASYTRAFVVPALERMALKQDLGCTNTLTMVENVPQEGQEHG